MTQSSQEIYGSLYKLSRAKKWVCKTTNLGKKRKILDDTKQRPPPRNEYEQIVR